MSMFSVDAYFAEKLRAEKLEKQREKAAKYCAEQRKFPFFGYEGEDQTLMYRVNDGEWKEFDGQAAELAKNSDNKIDVQIGCNVEEPAIVEGVYNIVESEGMIFIIGETTCWSNENFLEEYTNALDEIAEIDTINMGAFQGNNEEELEEDVAEEEIKEAEMEEEIEFA